MPKRCRGFTLVEILMAMMLLGVTGVSTLRAFSNASALTDTAENPAYYLASQHLANLSEAVRQDWWPNNGNPLSLVGAPGPAAETVSGRLYTPVSTIATSELNGDADEDFRRVRVVVSWP